MEWQDALGQKGFSTVWKKDLVEEEGFAIFPKCAQTLDLLILS